MSKRKLFYRDQDSPMLDTSLNQVTPHRSTIHPALLVPTIIDSVPKKTGNSVVKTPSKRNIRPAQADVSDLDSLSGSESDVEVQNFFANSNQKFSYTKEEDIWILKYVLSGQNIFRVGSLSLWKQLESKKDNPKRTYQSLKNRFLRNIRPCLFTTYAHITKDKKLREKILTKFPELKHQLGRRETLSKIKLPERLPVNPHKGQEEDAVSKTSSNESLATQLPQAIHSPVAHSVQPRSTVKINSKTPDFNFFPTEAYLKEVKITNDDITVSVNFSSKRSINISQLGIYEKFKKLESKNKLVLCPTCGCYNNPKEVSLVESSKETDIFIPCSVGSPKGLKENPDSRKEKGRRINSNVESSKCSPSSPSLLSKDSVEGSQKNNAQVDEVSNSASVVEKNISTQLSNPEVEVRSLRFRTVRTPKPPEKVKQQNRENKNAVVAKASNSKSSKEGDVAVAKRRRDSDEDLDSICEDAMANFRKLIDYEEEQQLVRKCLNKNIKSFGLEAVPQTDWDSYFLEFTSDEGTPPLTIDYETDSQNNENETLTVTGSDASLSQNMKRMLRERKKKP